MSARKFLNLSVILTFFVATVFNSCSNKSNQEQTVKEVMDHTVTRLYKTMNEKQLDSLSNDQVMALFNEQEKKVLATKHWSFDVNVPVVVSVGRRPFADQLGLDGTAVKLTDRGFVEVDEWCRTGEAGVYAIGDVIATPQLAHVGYAEAILVVKQMLGEHCKPVMYDKVPWAIYCHPEVAFAGHSEQSAIDAGLDIAVSKHQFRSNSRAQILGETDGLVKVIAVKEADGTAGQIVGVHMVGPWVTEQLGQGYLAVNWEATVAEVAAFIQPHPSLSELFGESVLALTGRSLNA